MSALEKLAPRERALISVAAVLLALFLIWQFLISPFLAGAQTAQRQLDTATRNHAIVTNGLPRMSLQDNVNKATLDQNGVFETARNTNVSISRVQPGSGGSIQIWVEDSPAQNVYSFLSELDRTYNAATTKAQLTRRDGGTIAAQFTFAPK